MLAGRIVDETEKETALGISKFGIILIEPVWGEGGGVVNCMRAI